MTLTDEERVALAVLLQTLEVKQIRSVRISEGGPGRVVNLDLAHPVAVVRRLLERTSTHPPDGS